MAEQIDLVYPLYLDVPMMTSFVAALEDGIAYGSDVTQMKNQKRTVAAEGEGGRVSPAWAFFRRYLTTSLADQFQIDDEGRMGLQLMQRIREDLAQSKVLDAVMRPSGKEDLSVVMALEFLPEGALDNMLSGDFSVLGKVTQLIKGSDEIGLYQRTVFKNLDSESFDETFDGLRKSPLFKLSERVITLVAVRISRFIARRRCARPYDTRRSWCVTRASTIRA